jgi:hypothetical protein
MWLKWAGEATIFQNGKWTSFHSKFIFLQTQQHPKSRRGAKSSKDLIVMGKELYLEKFLTTQINSQDSPNIEEAMKKYGTPKAAHLQINESTDYSKNSCLKNA